MTRGANKEPLWTRDLVLASLVNLCLAFVFYALMTTMAMYAVERFGASDTIGGLASSVFVIGAMVARLFAGNLVDLIGRRRALVISLAVFAAASLGYLPVDSLNSLAALLVVRVIHGMSFAVAATAATAIAQAIIPPSRRAEGTGYFTLTLTLATAVGPFLALMLVRGPGYTALFAAGSVAAALAMIMALLLRSPDIPLSPQERTRLRRFHPSDMLHLAVVPVAAFMFVTSVGYSGVVTFLESHAGERGLESGAKVFFLVYAAVLFLARLVAGRLQDRRGANVVVYPTITAFAVGLAVLAVATSDVVLVLAGGLIGLGFGTLMSAMQSVAVSRVPMQRVGGAISTHFFMVDVGMGLGPVVLGLLLSHVGYDEMYLLLAVVVLLSAALYHLVHGRVERDRRRSASAVPEAEPVASTR